MSRLYKVWDGAVQVLLPASTVLGFALIAGKQPAWGLLVSLIAQIFWLYSTYRAWRSAGQIGMLINSILNTFVFAYGVVNYWFF